MYIGQVEVDEVAVLALMELAQSFQIDSLVAECSRFITENIKPRYKSETHLEKIARAHVVISVAVDYLEMAAKLGKHLLYRHCLEYIQQNFEKVSVTRSFLNISEKSFDAIIRTHQVPLTYALPRLSVFTCSDSQVKCDEVNIFKAVIAWGQHRADLMKAKMQKAEDAPRDSVIPDDVTLLQESCAKLICHVRYQLMSPQGTFPPFWRGFARS